MGEGTTVNWFIDGESVALGYFHKWAIPVPGDRVLMREYDPHMSERKDYEVEVTHRTFSQPEQDHPWIQIHAKRVVPTDVGIPSDDAHLAELDYKQQLLADVGLLEDIIGSVYLHGDSRWLTRNLTTEEKERFADAVDAWSDRLNERMDAPDDGHFVRWWRE